MTGIIFRKTKAGAAAIGDRVGSLPRGLRTLLIMVNGETPTESLIDQAHALHQGEAALIELLNLGLIEPNTGVLIDPTTTESFAPATNLAGPVPQAIRSLALARAYAAAYMRDFTGDQTDTFATLFTHAENEAELLQLIENCAQVIADVDGIESAARFTRRTRALLPMAA